MAMKWQKACALLVGLQLLFAVPVSADTNVLVTVNGHVTDWQHPTILVNGRTYMSADDLAAALHGTVKKNSEVVVLQFGDKSFHFKLKTNEVATANKFVKIDQGAIVRGQVVYLPLRYVMDQMGIKLQWDAANKAVTIVTPEGYDAFKLITADSLSEKEKAFVNQVKTNKGIHKWGNLYVIARGQSPNPGYGLKVVKIEQGREQMNVYVKLTKPEPGLMYPQVIAYPYLLARVNLPPYTTIHFYDAATNKPLFE
jgi:hypothetical protein